MRKDFPYQNPASVSELKIYLRTELGYTPKEVELTFKGVLEEGFKFQHISYKSKTIKTVICKKRHSN